MIYFSASVRNPYWNERFANLWYKWGNTPLKNKQWEAQFAKTDNLLHVEISITTRQDHAGARLELALFGYELHLHLYDRRHWDDSKGQWHEYG